MMSHEAWREKRQRTAGDDWHQKEWKKAIKKRKNAHRRNKYTVAEADKNI